MAVDKLQQSNAVLIGPYVRRGKLSITAASSASNPSAAMHLPPSGHGFALFPDAHNIAGPSHAVPKTSRIARKRKLDGTSAPGAKRRKS